MRDKVLNVCLHNIVSDTTEVKTLYDITLQQLKNIIKSLQKFRTEKILIHIGYFSMTDTSHLSMQ